MARAGVHGCTVITALTAQHPRAVQRIEPVPLAQMEAELHAVFDYFDVAVVKTGMLYDAARIGLLDGVLAIRHDNRPLIIDPVLRASSGWDLLREGGMGALHALIERATMITPNVLEAQRLTGAHEAQGEALLDAMAARWPKCAILLKGGHAPPEEGGHIVDRLHLPDGSRHCFPHTRLRLSRDAAHGTGCRLAALIAAKLAGQAPLLTAVDEAERLLQEWLARS
ncbi:MAG: bifunctional hydroxymethylpyrimidine kinase/phosphomethylpyrimidine kinase [Zetaproteobacteria bacterium]|nr:MAG: bifunctional hydroxymethylpyrimidine kinase/phosphomethylpyrimidine kinase [Zetaproteobacteria bacterium]